MFTIGLGISVVILILLVVLIGYCLVLEVVEHEDLRKRHEVLRDLHGIWVRRAVIAERKLEDAANGVPVRRAADVFPKTGDSDLSKLAEHMASAVATGTVAA